jgi:phage gpG-like protein
MADVVRMRVTCDAEEAMRRLGEMKARTMDFTPVFRYAKQQLRLANAANFTTGGLPVGGWKPRDGEEDYRWPIMDRTGHAPRGGLLKRSLTDLAGPPNVITPLWAEFGTDVEYAKFHQYGTRFMPARQVVYEPRGFAEDLAEKAAGYVVRGVI